MAEDFHPKRLDDGSVLISEDQAELHRVSEGIGLFIAAPLALWAATRKRKLTKMEKVGLGAVAIGTFVVDGALYNRYMKVKANGEL